MSTYLSDDWVWTLAANLLDTAAATQANPPAKQVIEFGTQPAWDCDQLTVVVGKIRPLRAIGGARPNMPSDPGPIEHRGIVPAVEFAVELIRCGGPTVIDAMGQPIPPTAKQINAWSQTLLTDGWALYRGLVQAWTAGTLLGADASFSYLKQLTLIGECAPLGPQGGKAGWHVAITTNLA